MTDIVLDPNTHDIDFSNGGMRLHNSLTKAIGQRVKIKTLLRVGEWYPDINKGVPYQQFLSVGSDKGFVDTFMQQYLSETEGVESLVSYNSTVQNRVLNITFSAKVENGEIEYFTIGDINVV
jgi:hypothetical protein